MSNSERTQIITHAISTVSANSRSKLELLVSKEPPERDAAERDVSEHCDKSIMLETINKSAPYLEIKRNLELDKDGNPCFSFSLISHSFHKDNKETYIGTFGQQEMLESLEQDFILPAPSLQKETTSGTASPKKRKSQRQNLDIGTI